jgi:sodium-dependent phosphate transporter
MGRSLESEPDLREIHQIKSIYKHDKEVDKMFQYMHLVTAAVAAFSHGKQWGNYCRLVSILFSGGTDVRNATSCAAAILSIGTAGKLVSRSPIPFWLMLLIAMSLSLGIIYFSVPCTVQAGFRIGKVTPVTAFAIQLSVTSAIVLSSVAAFSVSVTYVFIGSIIGGVVTGGTIRVYWPTVVLISVGLAMTTIVAPLISALIFTIVRGFFKI